MRVTTTLKIIFLNIKMGKFVKLERENRGACVLMSKMYSDYNASTRILRSRKEKDSIKKMHR
jgi:hypothetical protein